jgi:hypothetical protein
VCIPCICLYHSVLLFSYDHIIRSASWPQEASIEWSFVVYFGHAFQLAKKPIDELIEECSRINHLKKDYVLLQDFLLGSTIFLFNES